MGVAQIQAGNAAVSLTVDNKLKPGLDQAQRDLKTFATSVNQSSQNFFSNFMQNVKQQGKISSSEGFTGAVHPRYVLAHVADLLGGAGTGFGLLVGTFLLRFIGEAVAKAKELTEQFREGKISAGEMADGLARQIPILGQAWGIGRDIHEMLFGEEAAVKEINEEAKRTTDYFNAQAAAAKILRDSLRDAATEAKGIRTETSAIGKDSFTQRRAELSKQDDALADESKKKQDERTSAYDREQDKKIAIKKQYYDRLQKAYDSGMHYHGLSAEEMATQTDLSPQLTPGIHVDISQEVADAKAVVEARKQLDALRAEKAKAHADIAKGIDDEYAAKRAKNAKERHQLQIDEWNKFGQDMGKAIESAGDAGVEARADQLRREGHQADAEILLIQEKAEKKRNAIRKAAEDQAKAIGATSFLDPRRMAIMAAAGFQIAGVNAQAGQETEDARLKDFAQTQAKSRDVALANAGDIANPYEREKAEIKARYDYEISVAKKAGQDLTVIKARQHAEEAALDRKYQAVAEDMWYRIKEAQVQGSTTGVAQQKALLELQRKREIARESNPATATGESIADINKLYDQLEANIGRKSIAQGTYSGEAARAMAGGGPQVELLKRIAKATERTASKDGAHFTP